MFTGIIESMATVVSLKNEESNLFKQLTRLLSGPLVKYRRQDSRQLKKRRLEMNIKN